MPFMTRRWSRTGLGGAVAGCAGLLFAAAADAGENGFWTVLPRTTHRPASPLSDLVDRARPAVVHVRGLAPAEDDADGRKDGGAEKTSIGTGFIIHRDGYVVTNDHVVRGVTHLRVRPKG